MKTTSLIIAAASIGLIGSSYAEEGKKERPHRKLPPEIIEKFDKDGDGELNEEERKAARAARAENMKERRKERMKKFDTDGDGELSDAEKLAMREAMKKRALERFDKDGDGKLDEAEREEMRKAMRLRGDHKRPRGKDGKRGKKGDRKGEDAEAPGEL